MRSLRFPLSRRWMSLPPVLIGAAVLTLMVRGREGPPRRDVAEAVVQARVMPVPAVDLVPRALGYGTAEPGDVWQGVAQVSGRIVELHPRFETGEIIPAGAALLRIDPTDYELALRRVDAQLRELEVSEANTQASLGIESRSLELMESNLEDRRQLLEGGTLSSMQFDDEERATLAQRLRVQELENALHLIPTQRAQLEAQREQADLDLARTEITAPFACRITETHVDVDQFVNVGQVLVQADGIDVSEVPAQFFVNHLRQLIRAANLDVIPLTSEQFADLTGLGLSAVVRFRSEDLDVEWEGRVDRIAPQIDLQTRTIGIIVAVDEPYQRAIPGERPPLIRGMYCEVELRGRVMADSVVIPRSALHAGDVVHLVNDEGRLELRPVEVEFHQSNLTAVSSGLEPGELLVVSDLIPAIEGMRVEPREDAALAEALVAEATGRTSVR